jgi:predicted dithiol-disulfide oxidoreductase (DUF899 family)
MSVDGVIVLIDQAAPLGTSGGSHEATRYRPIRRMVHVDKEKAFTHQRERLAADRRALPWLRIGKPYEFHTTDGRKSLGDLFGGRSPLMIYHLIFPPNATYRCIGCSLLPDPIDAADQHLKHHDVSLVVCSLANFWPIRVAWVGSSTRSLYASGDGP